jgi:hypothetical protein
MKRLLISLLLLNQCYSAEYTRHVDTGVVGGDGDGTSLANAYSSLNSCLTAEATNLVSDTSNIIISLNATTGVADTTAAVVTGYTTSDAYDITITQADFPADGVFTDSEYVLHNDDSDSNALTTREDYLIINKLQVKVTGTSTNTRRGISAGTLGTSIHKYSKIIVKGIYSGTGVGYGFLISDADLTVTFDNCIVYGIISSDNPSDINFRAYETGGTTMSFYNCVAYGSYIGFSRTAGSMTCVNCISGNNTDDFNGTITATYCCSDDVKAGTGNVQPDSLDWDNELTDANNGDFHILSTGNVYLGSETTYADDANVPTDDIRGFDRDTPTDQISIGAYKFGFGRYLDINADGENDGTSWTDAWKTLSDARGGAASGDVVSVADGDYGGWNHQNWDAYTDWVVYQAVDGNDAVIMYDFYTGNTEQKDYYHKFLNVRFDSTIEVTPPDYIIRPRRSKYTTFEDCTIEGELGRGSDTTGVYVDSDNVTIDNMRIFGAGGETNGTLAYGIRMIGNLSTTIIQNCDISGTFKKAVITGGSEYVVTNNHIHTFQVDGISVDGATNTGAEYSYITYNTINGAVLDPGESHCDLIQLNATDTTNIIIRGNVLYDCINQGIFSNPTNPVNVIYENNLIYDCEQDGTSSAFTFGNGTIIRSNTIDGELAATSTITVDRCSGNIVRTMYIDYNGGATINNETYNLVQTWDAGRMSTYTPGTGSQTLTQGQWEALFRDFAGDDYSIASDSGATGIVPNDGTTAATVDIHNKTRTSPTSAGAYEFLLFLLGISS